MKYTYRKMNKKTMRPATFYPSFSITKNPIHIQIYNLFEFVL